MAINVNDLWDHSDPELSEQRFRDALEGASPHDRLVLQTQIARTYGLRRDFDRARQALANIEPHLGESHPEAKARYWLELGRTHCSATHTPEAMTDSAKSSARDYFLRSFEIAKDARLDGLAVDALHMMTMVESHPEAQVDWNLRALEFVDASDQESAKKWEGSLRNNLGYAYHLAGRYDEALGEFHAALAVREKAGSPESIRVAKWMIAWTLRAMGNSEEALTMQLQLEQECCAAGEDDPYVFDELEKIYRALGDAERADHYEAKSQTLSDVPS